MLILGVSARVISAVGGAATFDVEDQDGLKWLKNVSTAENTTADLQSLDTATFTSPKFMSTPQKYWTIRGNTNFNSTGTIRVTVAYLSLTAPVNNL